MNTCNIQKINNFQKDSNIEHKISQFLDENFYSHISSYVDYKRTNELSDQYAGIDLYLNNSMIDEKSKNTNNPNEFKDYYASLEIYHTTKDGRYEKGWFTNPNIKTTHYFFEYRFEDQNADISSVIIVSFQKQSMKDYLDNLIGYDKILDDASNMQYAKKGIDDIRYTDIMLKNLGKLTKTYENATVLTFKLTDLQNVKGSTIIYCERNKKPRKLSFKEVRSYFT